MFKNLRNALETPEESDKNLELSPPPQREQASLERTSLPNVSDINNFTTSFQSLIYNYFASNYGTVKPQELSTTQHPNKTVKNMKKDLKQLKLLGRNDHSST
ncbi:hypothetical protein HELRODRAFT_179107 [Helobdella robusta]|uniref:Uncharacterized protein n=1 Tax=Helobdella robusta TaxID=6412 RepID=T1FE60_HELRO|nr:hypothetical protein HELRODRAFT_179107 [Helobdella robusta]ESN95638.1 hypothetical protein HELRODRAFT_179107 [Helobdella robusta]